MNNNNIIEVRQNLLRALESLDASSPTTSSPSTAVPTQSTQAIMAPTTAAAAAAAEQRRLFSFGRPAKTSNQTGKGKSKGKRPPTCTIKFVCLASKDATKPPTSVREKAALCNGGLGDGSITFDVGSGSDHCHLKMIEKFPKLATAGGYELMLHQRGGGDDAGFHPINPPYTPSRLKDFAGQAKMYIRPLQRDIDINYEDQAEGEVSE